MVSEKSEKSLRKQMFVDPKVQGTLAWRVAFYWLVCLGNIFMMLLCWRVVTEPPKVFYAHVQDMWSLYGPTFLVAMLLLPLVIVDMIRLSNRFAGPMVRLRRAMGELARGEHVEPIRFRNDDFWQDFAEEFNALAARVQHETNPVDHDENPEPVGAGADGY